MAGPSWSEHPRHVAGGSLRLTTSRITILWPDNAIQKQWLQVTAKVTDHTGLADIDVFYWGNAIGESGLGDTPLYALVNGWDAQAPRNNPHSLANPAGIADFADYSRDRYVNAWDVLYPVNNATNITNALRLITVPELSGGGAGVAAGALLATSSAEPIVVGVNAGSQRLIAPVLGPAPAVQDSPANTTPTRPEAASPTVLAAYDAVFSERAAPQRSISGRPALLDAASLYDLEPTSAETRESDNHDSAVDEVLAADGLSE